MLKARLKKRVFKSFLKLNILVFRSDYLGDRQTHRPTEPQHDMLENSTACL